MIGQIAGTLIYQGEDHVLVRAGGVGYVITCTAALMRALPALGNDVALHTDLLVQENNLQLFGFLTLDEKQWYRLLVSVSGIGARGAIAVLNTLNAQELGEAIMLGNWHAVKAAPGIGPKIAQRIVNELKDKTPSLSGGAQIMSENAPPPSAPSGEAKNSGEAGATGATGASDAKPPQDESANHAAKEALSALVNLGYDMAEAMRAVSQTRKEGEAEDVAGLIRGALQKLVRDMGAR